MNKKTKLLVNVNIDNMNLCKKKKKSSLGNQYGLQIGWTKEINLSK